MYSWKTKIRYTETEQDGRLSLTAMINLLQDCSTFHTEESGRGLAYHLPRHEGWYIFSWQIDIDEMPILGEEVSVNTWPASYQGVIVNRDFEILRDSDGKSLLRARSIWALMNLDRLLPLKLDEEKEFFPEEGPVAGEWGGRKLRLEKDLTFEDCRAFDVAPEMIDTNQHMNNAFYIYEASTVLPKGKHIRGIRTEYKAQALLGDTIYMKRCVTEDSVTVLLNKPDGDTYAVIRFLTKEEN